MNPLNILKRLWWAANRTVRGNRYQHLFKEIEVSRPRNILEVGTWNGNNAVKMIEAAARHIPAGDINYYGFDLFQEMTEEVYQKELSKRPPSMEDVQKLLSETGANIHLYKGDSNKILPETLPQLPPLDLVFIDGGHSVQTIANDWLSVSQYMADNTIVIFDDYWENRKAEGCKTVVDGVDQSQYDVTVFPTADTYDNKDFGKLVIKFAKIVKK